MILTSIIRFILAMQFRIALVGLLETRKIGGDSITVATYNIWNVMFHWEVRKLYIADMIRFHSPDVIAFQEVRANRDLRHNQILDLQQLLPQYQHVIYHPVNYVQISEEVHPPGWEWEGLGLLSKHYILSRQIMNLTRGPGPDKNLRALLSVQILYKGKELSVTNVHLSYDRYQQCRNAKDVLKFLYSTGTENSIILGDFNAVDDFVWPVSAIMNGQFPLDSPRTCSRKRTLKNIDRQGFGDGFVDAWMEVNPRNAGYTFSNMPTPGMQSRPDRVLVSRSGLKVLSAALHGTGEKYEQLYKKTLTWYRLYTVYKVAKDRALGNLYDYTCHWNCGPHGSCRCGICVQGDDQHTCSSQECFECDPIKLLIWQIMIVFLVPCVFYLVFFVLDSLLALTFNRPHRYRFLVRSTTSLLRSKYVFCFASCFCLFLVQALRYVMQDALTIVDAQLKEELFPSDHLMVNVKLQFTY